MLAIRVPVFVGPTGDVMFEGVAYSMPPEAANVAGTAFVYEDRIRFEAGGRHKAEHTRRKPGDPPARRPQDRAAKLAAVHGGRAQLYEMRQPLLELGEDSLELLTTLLHRSPQRSREHVVRLHALLMDHGEDAMRAAFGAVVRDGTLDVASVERALASPRSQGELFSAEGAPLRPRGRR